MIEQEMEMTQQSEASGEMENLQTMKNAVERSVKERVFSRLNGAAMLKMKKYRERGKHCRAIVSSGGVTRLEQMKNAAMGLSARLNSRERVEPTGALRPPIHRTEPWTSSIPLTSAAFGMVSHNAMIAGATGGRWAESEVPALAAAVLKQLVERRKRVRSLATALGNY